ncbi:hypothetical protein JCM3770_005544 [Rhodotorula araucariae]
MPPPRSRIPRSAASHSAVTTTDENAPPSTTSLRPRDPVRVSAIPLAPTAAKQPAAKRPLHKSASAATLVIRQDIAPAPAPPSAPVAEIAIQHPSSSPRATSPDAPTLVRTTSKTAFNDETDDDDQQNQMPPDSQSPTDAPMLTQHGGQPSRSLLAPPPATRTSRSHSLSAQPSSSSRAPASARRASQSPALPPGPPHAPQVLAARRRSTVSPLPHAPAPAPAPASAGAQAPKSTATGRRKGKKLRPRPSETLVAPLELASSDDGDDPLLLLGPEQTRGRGEGKRRREVHWSTVPLAVGVDVGRRRSVKPEEASLEMDRDDAGELRAPGDGERPSESHDSGAAWDDDEPAQPYQPVAFGGERGTVGASEDFSDLGGLDEHQQYEPQAFAHAVSPLSDPGNGAAAGGIGLGLGDLSPPSAGARAEAEKDEGSYAPLWEASSDVGSSDHQDGIASSSDDDNATGDADPTRAPVPTMRRTRPSYPPLSPNRTGEWDAVVPVALGSSPPRALREPTPAAPRATATARASFPPLSPNTTGEWDAVIEVRLDSSPARRGGTAMESEEEDEAGDVEAGRGRRASDWRVKAEEFEEEVVRQEVAVEQQQPRSTDATAQESTPAPATSRAYISTPANLLFSTIRSPSPAFSPRPLVPPSSAARASRSPQPQLSFASPRDARAHLAHLVPPAQSQSQSPAPAAPPRSPQAWTRGPAFFRSSSFSPPPHADLPRTATLYARRPGRGARGDQDEGEESREYYRFAEATATSPDLEDVRSAGGEVAREGEEVGDDDAGADEGDAEVIVLVGQEAAALERARTHSRSLSPAGSLALAAAEGDTALPPTLARDSGAPSHTDDERMSSPVSSTGSNSPARSVNGDAVMSSPSPRNSPAVASGSPKILPLTPGPRDEDARMGSPSPLRTASPLKVRLEGFVEEGRTKLQGLLFGAARAVLAQPKPVDQRDEPTDAGADEDDDDDEPFPHPMRQHPRPPISVADSTVTTSRSHASFASSSSHRPHRRSRPSHPAGLPVIEISSTDARAAARAAAILKVHHKYVEQGIAAVDAARIAQAEVAAAVEGGDDESDDEEELRTLLLDAEDELRDGVVPRALSASPSEAASTAPVGWSSRDWRMLEQTLVELGRRHRRGTSISSAGVAMSMTSEAVALASVTGEDVDSEAVVETFLRRCRVAEEDRSGEWAWDKLVVRVDALKARRAKDVRERRASSASTGFPPAPSRAGRAPLTPPKERSEEEIRRASSPAPEAENIDGEEQATTPEPAVLVKQELASDDEALARAGGGDSESEYSDEDGHVADDTFFASSLRDRRPRRGSIEPVYVPTALANPALRHLYDDFQPEKPKLPLKDYLREDSPPSASDSGNETDESGIPACAPRESTPDAASGPAQPPKSPSSAQRLFSYIGSFVRRSPAPAPSPSSSTHARAGSSSTSPPPTTCEMAQVRLSSALVTPQFASTAKPYPPLPTDATHKPLPQIAERAIRPLPHHGAVHRADASTSRVALDSEGGADCSGDTSGDLSGASSGASQSLSLYRRRRRSSGEGGGGRVWAAVEAIEELESSREEEESRIVELLQVGGTKRRAAGGDLRSALGGDGAHGKGKGKARETEWARGFVEIDEGRTMIPTGTRALDRRVSGEKRASRR